MDLARLKEIIEEEGWTIEEVSFGGDNKGLELFKYSPAGEDFSFVVNSTDDPKEIIKNIFEYEDEYDPNEHMSMWVESAGTNGTPDLMTLAEDAKDIGKMIEELADAIRAEQNKPISELINNDSVVEESKSDKQCECPQCGKIFSKDDLVVVDEEDLDIEEDRNKQYFECPECGYRDIKKSFKIVETKIQEAENDEQDENNDEEENEALEDLIQEWKDKDPLHEWVIDDILDDSENYDGTKLERIKLRLDDISHGLVTGVVSSLIYYSDTVAFYNKFEDDIYDYIDYLVDNGLEPLEAIKNTETETEILIHTDSVINRIVWMVYEEIAYEFGNDLESL